MALLHPLPAMCFNASGCAVCQKTLVIRIGLHDKFSKDQLRPATA